MPVRPPHSLPIFDRLRLSKQFSGLCLAGIVAAVIGIGLLQHSLARKQLVADQTRTTSALARALGNAIWAHYGVVLSRGWQRGGGPNAAVMEQLEEEAGRLTEGLAVVHLDLIGAQGQRLFSSTPATAPLPAEPLARALSGTLVSLLEESTADTGAGKRARPLTTVLTLTPLRSPDATLPDIVLAIRVDVSEAAQAMTRRTQALTLGTGAALLVLYLFLLLIVRRAERDVEAKTMALARSEADSRLLALSMEQTSDAVLFQDIEGRVQRWNRAAERLYGYTAEEAVGRFSRDLHLAGQDQAERTRARERLALPTGYRMEAVRRTKSGASLLCEVTVTPVETMPGHRLGHIIISRDVTERRRMERELVAAKEQAEAASRVKGEFLANMSHEMRTPLNAIIGMTGLALDATSESERQACLESARRAAEILRSVVDQVLDFAKIEAGKLEVAATPYSLRACVAETARTLAITAQQEGLELMFDVAPDVPDGLIGDPVRLRQVLVNLLGNAVKFTPAGEVELTVTVALLATDHTVLRFAVRDTGIGIPAQEQARIFDAFAQADGSTSRRFGGTGLGLTISSRLVAMMGGRIEVASRAGAGSTFSFDVRAGLQPQARPALEPTPITGERPRVVVLDGNRAAGALLARQIGDVAEVVAVASLDDARAAVCARPTAVAFVAASLDGSDGFLAAIDLRALAPGLRVVMMTLAARPADATRCRELGLAQSLTKPFSREDALRALADPCGAGVTSDSPTVATAPRIASASRALSVLVAEDNVVNQRVVRGMLGRMGHHVEIANDGAQAVHAFERGRFDVVLMDVQMPEIDGLEATRRIRALESDGRRRTPIIANTANAMPGDRERCLAAGMDGYVAKPIDPAVLASEIERVTAQATDAGRAHAPQSEVAPDIVFDRALALARMDGDETLLGEVAELFLADGASLVARIEQAITSGDLPRLSRHAHTLKGSAANVSAPALAARARALEHAAKAGDAKACTALAAVIADEYARLASELAAEVARVRRAA